MVTAQFVTSVCHENVEVVVTALQAYGSHLVAAGFTSIKVTVYCKCSLDGQSAAHSSHCSAHLPNVGREGHTWLEHMARDQLGDVVFFVNPGIISGAHAGGIWHKAFVLGQTVTSIARLAKLDRHTLEHSYADGVDHPIPASLCNVPAEAGGCAGIVSAARARHALLVEHRQCRTGMPSTRGTSTSHADLAAASPRTLIGYCSNRSTRCNMCTGFHAILRCEECPCDAQASCMWNGATDRARRSQPPHLMPARPASFAAWACKHWGIPPMTVQRCRWQWTGTFAVGSALIRQRNVSTYRRVAAALAAAGREGGVEGHFMERLWRSIFYCSLGGRPVHDIGVATAPEQYMYPASKYEPHDWKRRVPAPTQGGGAVAPFWASSVAASIRRGA